MPGLKLVIPTTFTDATLPILRDDPVLPSAGALFLIEPGHPANPLVGNPANGALIPNIALPQAQALIPAGTAATLSAALNVGSTFDAGGLRERSGKGGLHFIVTQASAGLITRMVTVEGQGLVRDYLIANPTHKYFISRWARVTRPQLTTANTTGNYYRSAMLAPASGNAWIFYIRPASGETQYPTDARRTGQRGVNVNNATIGPALQNIGLENVSVGMSNAYPLICTATGNGGVNVADFGKGESSVFYRFYLEDLTVSGRPYATVDALDFAEFTKQVVTAGGRYYGDTYTNPTTVP